MEVAVYTANAASIAPKTITNIKWGRVSNLPFRLVALRR